MRGSGLRPDGGSSSDGCGGLAAAAAAETAAASVKATEAEREGEREGDDPARPVPPLPP